MKHCQLKKSLDPSVHIHIHIHIKMCVCVCVHILPFQQKTDAQAFFLNPFNRLLIVQTEVVRLQTD
jgi:hypothetical protein